MDKPGILDDVFEQGGQIVKNTAKQLDPKAAGKATVSQVAPTLTHSGDQGTEKTNQQQQQKKPIPPAPQNLAQTIIPKDPTPEDLQKMEKVRVELHQNYYQNLVNPPKPKEEKPKARVERLSEEEDNKKFMEQKKKQEKELPVNVRQGTGEKQPGISG